MASIRIGGLLAMVAALLVGCGGAAEMAGGSGVGGSGVGGSGVGGSGVGGSGVGGSEVGGGEVGGIAGADPRTPPHKELCLYGGSCTDAVFTGEYGVFCMPFSFRCENGCRERPEYVAVTDGNGNVWDVTTAVRYATAAYCNPSGEGGEGGEGGTGGG